MDKKTRLLEIIGELQELYPKLDRLMVNDLDDPDTVIITSEDRLEEIASELGIDTSSLDDITEEDLDSLAQLTFNIDDDKGGGIKH